MGRSLKQKSGKVYLQGQDLNNIHTKQIAQHLALLPQHPIAPAEFKVEELISYGRYPHRNNVNKLSKEDKEAIEWAMDLTNTISFRQRRIGSLSGGQRQNEKNIDARLFLAVGSLEKDFMIEDAKALSKRLLHLADSRLLQIEFNEIDGENHVSVVPTVLSRALRFVSSNNCTN